MKNILVNKEKWEAMEGIVALIASGDYAVGRAMLKSCDIILAMPDFVESKEDFEMVVEAVYNKDPQTSYDCDGEFYTISYKQADSNSCAVMRAKVRTKAAINALRGER